MKRFLHAIFSISLPTSWHVRQNCRGLGHQVVSGYSRQWTDLNLGKRRKQVSQCLEAASWGFQNKAVNTISCEYSDTMNKARKLVPVVKHSQHEVLTWRSICSTHVGNLRVFHNRQKHNIHCVHCVLLFWFFLTIRAHWLLCLLTSTETHDNNRKKNKFLNARMIKWMCVVSFVLLCWPVLFV